MVLYWKMLFLVSEHLYKGRVAETLKISDPFEMKRTPGCFNAAAPCQPKTELFLRGGRY